MVEHSDVYHKYFYYIYDDSSYPQYEYIQYMFVHMCDNKIYDPKEDHLYMCKLCLIG